VPRVRRAVIGIEEEEEKAKRLDEAGGSDISQNGAPFLALALANISQFILSNDDILHIPGTSPARESTGVDWGPTTISDPADGCRLLRTRADRQR
jgi:hypothetical protein